MVNRRIFVVGFGLYGSIHGPKEYYVTIQVIIVIKLGVHVVRLPLRVKMRHS